MCRYPLGWVLVGLAAAACGPTATAAESGPPQQSDESPVAWQWYHQVSNPEAGPAGLVDFILPEEVFDQARADLGDLRLRGRGGWVPYALRERHARKKREALPARQVSPRTNSDGSVELRLDLGESPVEYQDIDVLASGEDFRRRVQLEGSDDGATWGFLLDDAWVAHLRAQSQVLDLHTLRFASSRFRYLRVRVFPDVGKPGDSPQITSTTVYHTVEQPGEYVTRPAKLGPWQPVKAPGGSGSAWLIDLGGEWVPCQRLSFEVADADFARPYVLETVEEQGPHRVIAQGYWRRRAGSQPKPLGIRFSEVKTRRLRLVVTDHRNPPLTLNSVHYTAAARQVIFQCSQELAEPLQLYVGNPKAKPPHYDFAANLPRVPEPPPQRTTLGPRVANPDYQPEPKPWTERWPWMVYVVLGAASVVLLVLLGLLARSAVARHDASQLSGQTS